jgi:hypothetical protein
VHLILIIVKFATPSLIRRIAQAYLIEINRSDASRIPASILPKGFTSRDGWVVLSSQLLNVKVTDVLEANASKHL